MSAQPDFSNIAPIDPTLVQKNHQFYQFDDGQVLAVSAPPIAGITECESAVSSCVATLQSFIKQNQAITGDQTLSLMGKQNKKGPVAVAAIKSVWRQYDAVASFGGSVMTKKYKLFAVPAIAPGNAVQVLSDRECRDWWRALPTLERNAVLPKLCSGQLPSPALALIRSPVPLDADEELVDKAWRASVRAENIGEVVDLEGQDSTCNWAMLLIIRVAAMLAKAGNLGDKAISDALKSFEAPDKGPFAIGYAPTAWHTAA
jgi:hypothetical protein